jgi:hypothetical protein
MNRLESITKSDTLVEFAQGAAQEAIQPVADFLAPTVPVSRSNGRFKIYSEKHRFRIPDTLRAVGGRATELRFEAADGYYNCEPHALDYPVDNLEQFDAQGLQDVLKEGATAVAEVAALSHEKKVIDMALTSVGAGTAKTWNASADPVADVDEAILTVIKNACYGSLMGVGVLFGAGAWQIFKNSANVRSRFLAGNSKSSLAVATEEIATQLFIARPTVKVSLMVYDTAPEGLDKNISFLLDNTVLVFARKANPTTRDPSFMKTFRLMNRYMVPGSYIREDGRVEVAKFDWSEEIRVTNPTAALRYNIAAA